MADAPATTRLTIEEFIRLYESEGAFEIIDGERIPPVPPTSGHSYIIHQLLKLLLLYASSNQVGEIMTETTFILPDSYSANWVKGSRIPDLMFYQAERLETYRKNIPNWRDFPYMLVPDLAAEVVSTNDSYSDINHKVELYLRDGVQVVWVIDPNRRNISIYAGDHVTRLSEDDDLSGGAVIPGFSVRVGAIFD